MENWQDCKAQKLVINDKVQLSSNYYGWKNLKKHNRFGVEKAV